MIFDILCMILLIVGLPLAIFAVVLLGVWALSREDEKKRKGGKR